MRIADRAPSPLATAANVHTWLFDSAQRGRLSVAWCVWALMTTGLVVVFDLEAPSYLVALLIAEVMLARRSFHRIGSRYFLALCFLPVVPLLVMALPVRFVGDFSRLMALVLSPLVALGAVAVLATDDARAGRGMSRVVVVAVVAIVGLGVRNGWRPPKAPMLDTPAGRATVAGCYRVERGLSLPYWTNREWPPAVARFDTARWERPEEDDRAARMRWNGHVGGPYWGEAMIQSPSGTPGWWRPTGPGSVSVNWTHTGLGGFRGTFRLAGADLVGGGEWFQDFNPGIPLPPRLLAVHMYRIDCAEMR